MTSSAGRSWAVGAVIVGALALPTAATAQVPDVDIQATCRAAANVTVNGFTAERNLDLCLDAEQSAAAQLAAGWDAFSATHKTQCVRPAAYLASYVEWLTCLELESYARKIRMPESAGATPELLDSRAAIVLPTLRASELRPRGAERSLAVVPRVPSSPPATSGTGTRNIVGQSAR